MSTSAPYVGAMQVVAGATLVTGVTVIAGPAVLQATVPKTLYHLTSLQGSIGIGQAGTIQAGSGLYGFGVYASAFQSRVFATLQGAASTQVMIPFSTAGLRVVPTFFPGTYRVLGNVPVPKGVP